MPTVLLMSTVAQVQAQLPAVDDVPRLWPQPASVTTGGGSGANLALDPDTFKIVAGTGSESDILDWNIAYYTADIFARPASPDVPGGPPSSPIHTTVSGLSNAPPPPLTLARLEVVVGETVDDASYPTLGMDEGYNLTLGSPQATLRAPTVWGAVRGLETFSQLLQMNGQHTIRGGDGMVIVDTPRFPWRGLMLDPARHFLDVSVINSTIDAMAQNKLNALHLHLTDGESFSVNTEKWPTFSNLSVKGAYSPALSYSKADLEAVVARGRLRGVRVIPEFDLPAHMASWAQGYEGLITDCPSVNPHPEWPRYYSPADVTNPLLYAAIAEILTELAPVFPDLFWHVGGDEPHFDCWAANPNVTAYQKAHNLNNEQLYGWFEGQYAGLVSKHGKQVVGWEEIQTTASTSPDPKTTVVEVWEGNKALAGVVEDGFSAIVSSAWYLNEGGDWTKYYSDDPMSYLPSNASAGDKARVLGGEACMWNSAFSAGTNMEPAIWPNAAAMAEQLWSASTQPVDQARTRLSQHRCRMVRRGIRAGPIAEDYCGSHVYVRKSRSFYYPGDFPFSPETPGP